MQEGAVPHLACALHARQDVRYGMGRLQPNVVYEPNVAGVLGRGGGRLTVISIGEKFYISVPTRSPMEWRNGRCLAS